TSATDATFTFISSEAGSTFECQLDNGGWNSCTSPQLYNNLSVSSHTFDVRATDASANTDLTPASQTWVIQPDADPTVTSVSPANGATGVSAATSVDVVFSEAMDASTVNTSTFTLSTGGSAIPATVSYDAGTTSATLDPDSSLAALTTYDVSVQGATDSTGNTVVPFASSFTTGDTPSSVTLNPIDDARVVQNSANNNYGSDATLISDSSARQDSYVKFDASAVGNTVSSAVLRVYLTNGSGNGPELSLSDVSWSEGSITWNTRPATVSGTIADVGAVSSQTWIEYDVTAAVSGPGLYSFRFSSVSSDGTKFSSKEAGSNPPELVIQSNSGPDTTPPETVISSGPDTSTNSTTAQFAFQSFEPGVTFECLLDGGSWAPCASGIEYTGLAVGAHHFEVRATDAANNTDPTPAAYDWTIVGGSTLIFTPQADTYLSENRSTTNYGSSSTLTSDGGNGVDKETLLRFDVTGVSTSVTSVKLRVWVTNSTSNGPEVFATNPSWVESAVTWNTKPALTSGALFDAGPIPSGAWYEFDLSGSITADGTYSFTTISVSTDAVKFESKEGSNAPQLVLTVS
ncbi:MAG: Ig-like domain-containing protein, partial [Acidimicrobiales bacterium]|nr:Ig-like domain-containing protein [Acidimicrobiales bacterium]